MITPVFSRKFGEDIDLVETLTLVHANVMPGHFFYIQFPRGSFIIGTPCPNREYHEYPPTIITIYGKSVPQQIQ